MKSEWKKCKLGEICRYSCDKISLTSLNRNNYISTENMLPNKAGVTAAATLPNAVQTPGYSIGDTLISNIRPYFKKVWYANQPGGASNDVLIFKTNKNTDSRFLYYTLSDDKFFDYAMSTSTGTKMPRGNKKALMEYEINLPPLPVQKKIAGVLKSLDDKIELNRQISKNLEEQAQAIFKDWFIDHPKSDWKIGKLSEIAEITMGQSPDGSSYNENKMGVVFYQGRAEFGFRFPTQRLFTTQPKRMAKRNDILLSVRAPVGDINVANENCCIGRGLAAIHSKDNHQSFLLYTMYSLKEKLGIYNAQGTVFGCINRDALNDLEIVIPPKDVIDKFEKIASSLDAKIAEKNAESTHLTQIRDTILPKLMNGEIEVSDMKF